MSHEGSSVVSGERRNGGSGIQNLPIPSRSAIFHSRGASSIRGKLRTDNFEKLYRNQGAFQARAPPIHIVGAPDLHPRNGHRNRGGHYGQRPRQGIPEGSFQASQFPPVATLPPPQAHFQVSPVKHPGPFDPFCIRDQEFYRPSTDVSSSIHPAMKRELARGLEEANLATGQYTGFMSKHNNQLIPSIPRFSNIP